MDKDCRVCGALNVESREKAKFEKRDLWRLEFLAGLAVIAMQNAQNAERKEQSLKEEILATVHDLQINFLNQKVNDVSTVEVGELLQEINHAIVLAPSH